MRKSGKSSSNLQGMVPTSQNNKETSPLNVAMSYDNWLEAIGSNQDDPDYVVGEDCEVSASQQQSHNSSKPRTAPRALSSNTQTFIYHNR